MPPPPQASTAGSPLPPATMPPCLSAPTSFALCVHHALVLLAATYWHSSRSFPPRSTTASTPLTWLRPHGQRCTCRTACVTLWMRRFPGMTGSTPMLLWPAPLLQQLLLLCTHGEWLCAIDLGHTGLTAALTHLRTACVAQHSSTLSDIPRPTHQPRTLRGTYFYDIYSSPCRGICGNISLHASVGVSLCSLLRRRFIRTIYTTCPPPSALLGSPPYPPRGRDTRFAAARTYRACLASLPPPAAPQRLLQRRPRCNGRRLHALLLQLRDSLAALPPDAPLPASQLTRLQSLAFRTSRCLTRRARRPVASTSVRNLRPGP